MAFENGFDIGIVTVDYISGSYVSDGLSTFTNGGEILNDIQVDFFTSNYVTSGGNTFNNGSEFSLLSQIDYGLPLVTTSSIFNFDSYGVTIEDPMVLPHQVGDTGIEIIIRNGTIPSSSTSPSASMTMSVSSSQSPSRSPSRSRSPSSSSSPSPSPSPSSSTSPSLSPSPVNTNVLLAGNSYGGVVGIIKSTDSGYTWTQVCNIVSSFGGSSSDLISDFTKIESIPGTVLALTRNGMIIISDDYGDSWSLYGNYPNAPYANLRYIGNDTLLLTAGNSSFSAYSIIFSTKVYSFRYNFVGGITNSARLVWCSLNGIAFILWHSASSSPTRARVQVTTDYGYTWNPISIPLSIDWTYELTIINSSSALIGFGPYIYKTIDSSYTWTIVYSDPTLAFTECIIKYGMP